eukprot:13041896-Ditylum_brightwellii.AAC.1
MGKDWPGQSLSLGNLVTRMEYLLDGFDGLPTSSSGETRDDSVPTSSSSSSMDQDDMKNLAKRMLQLEIREAKMNVASKESTLAQIRTKLYGGEEEEY